MKLNKSPGLDGIPAEFYNSFWDDIKSVYIESIKSAYQVGELSVSQKREFQVCCIRQMTKLIYQIGGL